MRCLSRPTKIEGLRLLPLEILFCGKQYELIMVTGNCLECQPKTTSLGPQRQFKSFLPNVLLENFYLAKLMTGRKS